MNNSSILALESKKVAAMKQRMRDESYLTVLGVARRWGVSRALVEGLPPEILPYINLTPHSKRANKRYHPAEVFAAEVRLRRWEAAKTMGAGEEYLRRLHAEQQAREAEVLAVAQEAAA